MVYIYIIYIICDVSQQQSPVSEDGNGVALGRSGSARYSDL